MHVREKGWAQITPARQQRAREVERHPVDMVPKKTYQAHVYAAHQRERREKVLAELPVGDPRLALAVSLERERVDEKGAAIVELNVVGARILQNHAAREGEFLDREGR